MSMYFVMVITCIEKKKKNDFEKGAIFEKETFKQYESDNVESARGDVKKSKKRMAQNVLMFLYPINMKI